MRLGLGLGIGGSTGVGSGTGLFVPQNATMVVDFVNNQAWSNVAGFVNASAFFASVATTNIPVFDATGTITYVANTSIPWTNRGLFAYDSKTNTMFPSNDYANSNWTKAGVSVSSNTVGPDGLVAMVITEDGTNGTHGVGNTFTANSTVYRSFGVYAKAGSRNWLRLYIDDGGGTNFSTAYFDLANGTVNTVASGGTSSLATGYIRALANGYYHCRLSCIPSSADSTSVRGLLRMTVADNTPTYQGNTSGTIILSHSQFETGTSTLISPTVSASNTRSLSYAIVSNTYFTGAFNINQGTFIVEVQPDGPAESAVTKGYFSADDNSTANRIGVFTGTGTTTYGLNPRFNATSNNFSPAAINGVPVNTYLKLGLSYATGTSNVAFTYNGQTPTLATATSVPASITRFTAGFLNSAFTAGGQIRKVTYYPIKLSDAALQTQTT